MFNPSNHLPGAHTDRARLQQAATAMRALTLAAPRIAAAETLELRLREAGITAHARAHHVDGGGAMAVLVTMTGERAKILDWLAHYAVPVDPVSYNESLGIYVYAAQVQGQYVSLIIKQARGGAESLTRQAA